MIVKLIIVVAAFGAIVIGLTWRYWPYRCPWCGEPFDDPIERDAHLVIRHHNE